MSIRFNISNGGRARRFLLCCVAAGCLAGGPVQARPIEFSEPGSSDLTVNVSGLGTKPADLPSVEDQVFRPHVYQSKQSLSAGMKPLANSFRQNQRSPGLFDRDQNGLPQTPQAMLDSMLDRDVLKLPGYGAGKKPLDSWSSWDPYNLQTSRRGDSAKADSRSSARETNHLDGANAALNANDPFAAFSGRRPSADYPATLDGNAGRPRDVADWLHAGTDASPDARRDPINPAGRLDDDRRNQGLQTPGVNSGWLNPAATPVRGNSFVTDLEKFSRATDRPAAALFSLPSAPTAPTAPLAPGQTSLTPAPYTPPAKPKPLNVSAPRRNF